jgi:hypothetical protein
MAILSRFIGTDMGTVASCADQLKGVEKVTDLERRGLRGV